MRSSTTGAKCFCAALAADPMRYKESVAATNTGNRFDETKHGEDFRYTRSLLKAIRALHERILREEMESLPDVHPGCLIAACCFQERLFERDIHDLAAENLLRWRARFHERFRIIAEQYPPKIDVNLEALADMLTALTDGAIILSKTVRQKEALPRQIDLYRQYVEAIFVGAR